MALLRKIPKRHKDKFTDKYKPEVKTDGNNSLICSNELISEYDVEAISKLLLPVWRNTGSGTRVSYFLGVVYDNISKCPKSEYSFLYNMCKRFSSVNSPGSISKEITIGCKTYLDKINVNYNNNYQ